MAQAGKGRLSGGEITVVVVSALLVLVCAVLLLVRMVGSSGSTPDADATTESPPAASASPTPTETETAPGEDLSDVSFDFATPSGNIACAIDGERAVCGIAAFDYADSIPAGEVDGCEGTVGHFLEVTAEGAALVCDTSGQTLAIDATDLPVLDYGEQESANGFTCSSDETGVTCAHDETDYSFSVRRAGYTLS